MERMWISPSGAFSPTIAPPRITHIDAVLSNPFSSITPIFTRFSNVRGKIILPLASSKKSREKSVPALVDEEEDDFDGFDDAELDEFDEEDESSPVPFKEMRNWMRNKPSGFGEGKSYDTSVEDKLMEEIYQSRKAQEQNLNNLKNRAAVGEISKKKSPFNAGASQDVLIGACVRITGLPRKKNVHRDLKLAFIDFPNIINIIPAVEGNNKTRDPICKGFAFVDFKSEEAALKFVETYSRQSVLFGRVQKQITCNILEKALLSNRQSEKAFGLSNSSASLPQVESTSPKRETQKEGIPDPKRESPSVLRKKSPRKKREKAPVLSIQGSALRLKVKERAVLTGVLSKYGGQNFEDSKED